MTQADLVNKLDGVPESLVSNAESLGWYLSCDVVQQCALVLDLDQATEAQLLLAFGHAPGGWAEIAEKLDILYRVHSGQWLYQGWEARLNDLMRVYADWLGENDEDAS